MSSFHSVLYLWLVFVTTAALLASQTGTFPFSFMDIGPLEVGQAWLASQFGEDGFDSKLEEALERLVHVTLVVSAGRLVYACDTCRCGLHIHGCLVVRCFVRCFLFEPQASH
jgi:cytochrome b561